jgi:hypothetical protein
MKNSLGVGPFVALRAVQNGPFEPVDDTQTGAFGDARIKIVFVVCHEKDVAIVGQKTAAIR